MATPRTGRPRGRPRGTVRSHAGEIRKAIQEHAPKLVAKLLEAAEAGDVSAANALLDRVAPKLRPAACTFEVSVTGSQTELGQRLLGAVGRGQIAASDAAEILDLADRSAPPSSTIETIDYAALDEMYEQALQKAKEDDARMAHRRSESPPESKAPPTVNTEGVTST